jgi:hypothetical protein
VSTRIQKDQIWGGSSMGIRVHKILGYGLTDVLCGDFKIIDPRFTDRLQNDDFSELTFGSFIEFLEGKKELDGPDSEAAWTYITVQSLFRDCKKPKWDTYDSFFHDPEYGLKNVFVVVPAEESSRWYRHDDMIDYIEESSMESRVKLIDRSLYPYESYMDARTGERVRNGSQIISTMRYLEQLEGLEGVEQSMSYAKEHGFSCKEDLFKILVPYVPHSVRYLCEWAGIFKDPKTALELRPMVYVYWA